MSKERLEMFSDGVMAIAITLLVLEIKIPKHEEVAAIGGLYKYLIHIWPSYIGYVMSFLQIGIYWTNHHWLFSFVSKTNHTFNLLNVLFLMTISFMPFTTAVFSDFITSPEHFNAAVTAYCTGLLLPVITVCLVVFYAGQGHRLVHPRLKQSFLNEQYFKLTAGLLLAFASVALSFQYPMISLCIIAATFLIYLVPPTPPQYESSDASMQSSHHFAEQVIEHNS
jgi:uncharacterized membrane protein